MLTCICSDDHANEVHGRALSFFELSKLVYHLAPSEGF